MKKSELKNIIKEEIHKVFSEIKVEKPKTNLLDFVTKNKEKIASLNPDYTDVILNSREGITPLTPDLWSEEDYYSAYEDEGYTYDRFRQDWNKYNPSIVMLGEELGTVFVTDIPLPLEFANTLTGNDSVYFGARKNPSNAFKKYEINDRTLYIVWGIPDPGS